MHWVVLANDSLKEEFLAEGISHGVEIEWINDPDSFKNHSNADAFFDLLFEKTVNRKNILQSLFPKPVIINSVVFENNGDPFIRINAWNTFLKRKIIEAACSSEKKRMEAENIFSTLNRKTEWVPDIPGFISARIVAMIINEAYFTLEEKVSTKEEIDTAMKLGTNYPFGPFEWAGKIGLKNIHDLLITLSKTEDRYKPAYLLTREASL